MPKKKGKRKRLEILFKELRTVVIYESPHRILKTLQIFQEYIPNRKIVVIKELTKIHEKLYKGNINEVLQQLKSSNLKGEFVIILEGNLNKIIDYFNKIIFPADDVFISDPFPIYRLQEVDEINSWRFYKPIFFKKENQEYEIYKNKPNLLNSNELKLWKINHQ